MESGSPAHTPPSPLWIALIVTTGCLGGWRNAPDPDPGEAGPVAGHDASTAGVDATRSSTRSESSSSPRDAASALAVDAGAMAQGNADAGADVPDAGSTDAPPDADASPAGDVVFQERDGLVAVEAEHFFERDDNGAPRSWHLTSADVDPDVDPDPDGSHADGASGGAYLEGLPDTRVTHDDPLQGGVNFFNTPGTGPILRYRVHFETAGTYYVWARANTTGTEDNGVHVGIDGTWPSTGARMQWCGNRGSWSWSNAQRDSGGSACGVDGTITIEVDGTGEHVVEFSMREDGFELDKFVLSTSEAYRPQGAGPDESAR